MAGGICAVALLGAQSANDPPPVATYWMDVATASGMGAGMIGGQPDMQQMMAMMRSGGQAVRTVDLYLSSRTRAQGEPKADHFIPAAMQMGPSLPLIRPQSERPVREEGGLGEMPRPKGRMLLYWGCSERAGAGQPTVIDFSKVAAGQMPPGFASMMAGVTAAQPPRAGNSAGFGRWPNNRDSRPVPASASLVGAHRVEGNYSPPIAFSLAAGQDFLPALALHEAGGTPSGAIRLGWTPAARATGYALSMFGSASNGDVIVWTSANKPAAAPILDYLSPAQVRPLVASGAVLAPTASSCTIPAEVAKASPEAMVMMIGYGPEIFHSDKPKAPTWTTRVRFKTTATLMLGMGGTDSEDSDDDGDEQAADPSARKKKRFGLGDLIEQAITRPN